ncbi:MAG: polymer-forming cytoskeletal protein [Peptococcaceae bacterium]|jgi:cytoskeletal protein CcmA (bactofilin family)|nr:polymer-forming cytoskeletal protein [Peptococcaceae bacterium]
MFGRKENDVKPVTKSSNNSNLTYLAEESEIKGSFIAAGNARIDGKLEGSVHVTGSLVIGPTAVLKADIEAQNISIAGEVRGNVKVNELLELSSSARIYGDIHTKELIIDQGARFIGKSTYDGSDGSQNASSAGKSPTVPLSAKNNDKQQN